MVSPLMTYSQRDRHRPSEQTNKIQWNKGQIVLRVLKEMRPEMAVVEDLSEEMVPKLI